MVLLRISRKSFNDTLLKDKVLFMNPIELYRKLEDGGQGDRNENCAYRGGHKVYIKNEVEDIYEVLIDNSSEKSPININNGIKLFCFSYCDERALLQSANNEPCDFVMKWETISSFWTDEEEMEMLFFSDAKSFFDIFDISAKNQELNFGRGPVQYDQEEIVNNPQFLKDLNDNPFKYAFHKSKRYSDQYEYRFALQTPINVKEPYLLELANTDDISVNRFKLTKGKNIVLRISVDNEEEEGRICCEVVV